MSRRRTAPATPTCRTGTDVLRTFGQIVAAYIRDKRPRAQAEHKWWADRKERTLRDVMQRAALGQRPDGKRHDHHRRIPAAALREARLRLLEAKLGGCKDFAELHAAIEARIGGIRGIGELASYDIALRIGAFLRVHPERVYLHRGTREGARHLGLTGKTIEVEELPAEFQRLSPAECEDCLCGYADDIAAVVSGRRPKLARRSRDCHAAQPSGC